MKMTSFSKAVTLLCTTLLFACSEVDDLNLNNEFAKEREVSCQVEEETFVPLEKATKVASLFFSKLTRSDVITRSGSLSVETLSESGNPLMYVTNYPGGGFVIMVATKNYYPVLAYSDKGSFEVTDEIKGVSDWLEETKKAVKKSDTLNDTIRSTMQNLWHSYETADTLSSRAIRKARTRSSYSSGQIACWNKCDELQMQYGSEG